MVCYALSILDDDSVCIEKLCVLPTEVKVLDLAAYIYILYQENHSERLQLPAGPALP